MNKITFSSMCKSVASTSSAKSCQQTYYPIIRLYYPGMSEGPDHLEYTVWWEYIETGLNEVMPISLKYIIFCHTWLFFSKLKIIVNNFMLWSFLGESITYIVSISKLNYERMLTPHYVSHVTCHMSHVMSCVTRI